MTETARDIVGEELANSLRDLAYELLKADIKEMLAKIPGGSVEGDQIIYPHPANGFTMECHIDALMWFTPDMFYATVENMEKTGAQEAYAHMEGEPTVKITAPAEKGGHAKLKEDD